MFEIDDDFLTGVGYDVAALSDEQKNKYKQEIGDEVSARVQERIVQELDSQQMQEFVDIQESVERTKRWLDEFHADYRDQAAFKEIVSNVGDEDEAATFYAEMLWLGDAVPGFGEMVREVLEKYQQELLNNRLMIDEELQKS